MHIVQEITFFKFLYYSAKINGLGCNQKHVILQLELQFNDDHYEA